MAQQHSVATQEHIEQKCHKVHHYVGYSNVKPQHNVMTSLLKCHGYFNQYEWLSQLQICSLNTWHYKECVRYVGYPTSNMRAQRSDHSSWAVYPSPVKFLS